MWNLDRRLIRMYHRVSSFSFANFVLDHHTPHLPLNLRYEVTLVDRWPHSPFQHHHRNHALKSCSRLVFCALGWNKGFWVLLCQIQCVFCFFQKCESWRYAQARGIIGHFEERHHWGEKGRSNEMCYVSSCTTYIYLVFVWQFIMTLLYDGMGKEQEKGGLGFCPY